MILEEEFFKYLSTIEYKKRTHVVEKVGGKDYLLPTTTLSKQYSCQLVFFGLENGATCQIRTDDLMITNQLL